MKKIIAILLSIAMCLCFVGCYEEYAPKPQEEASITSTKNEDIRIWTDEETGVQYVIYAKKVGNAGLGGITPRLNADGTLYKIVGEDNE